MKRTTFLKSLFGLAMIPFIPLKGKEEKYKYWAKDGKGDYKSFDNPPESDGTGYTNKGQGVTVILPPATEGKSFSITNYGESVTVKCNDDGNWGIK